MGGVPRQKPGAPLLEPGAPPKQGETRSLNNTKEQFNNSPDFSTEQLNAIIDAFDAFNTMSKQALDSEKVRLGLRHILLGPAELYEALRARGGAPPAGTTT